MDGLNLVLFSKNIVKELNLLKVNNYTKPIKVPSGFLILKINDFKEEKKIINIEKEVEKINNIKINNQLKQFSNILIKKLKRDLIINEL